MLKICEWCGKDFEANVSYQIYCSSDCRAIATKNNSLIRQRQKKAEARKGKDRRCATCNKPLSVYNDESFCSSCIGSTKDYKKFIRGLG
jgi:predicted nucleic acid-binding Zn ribbon protein